LRGSTGAVWTGAIYFMADLTPAPYPLDRESMAVNGPLRTRIADHIRAHPEEYECFIASHSTDLRPWRSSKRILAPSGSSGLCRRARPGVRPAFT